MKNNRGSTLVYAITIIMILTVTITGALAISYTNFNRSLAMNSKRQSYLSAKTILENIVDEIVDDKSEYKALIPDGDQVVFNTLDIKDFPIEMGIVNEAGMSVSVKLLDNKKFYVLTVYASITYGGQTTILNADLEKAVTATKWQFLKYYEGEIPVSYNVKIASELLRASQTIMKYGAIRDADNMANYLSPFNDVMGMKVETTNSLANSTLRKYIYKVVQNGVATELQMNELNLPIKFIEKNILDKDGKSKKLYLHIMFGYQNAPVIPQPLVYATTKEQGDADDWKPLLVFLPSTGRWYMNADEYGNNQFPYMDSFNYDPGGVGLQRYNEILAACTEANIVQ